MWLFKKHFPQSIPQLNTTVGKLAVPIGLNQYFYPSQSELLFCYAADWFTMAYGSGTSEGRRQVSIYKTKKGNYIRVCQEMGERHPIMGETIEEEDVKHIYFETRRSAEQGVRHIHILVDNLNYEKEEV